MTVKDLLEFIEKNNIPLESNVYYERIEDVYFEKHGWSKSVLKKEGCRFNQQKELNNKVDSGEFNDKEQYPLIEDPEKFKFAEWEMECLKDVYIPAESCIKFGNDNNLYLTAHY